MKPTKNDPKRYQMREITPPKAAVLTLALNLDAPFFSGQIINEYIDVRPAARAISPEVQKGQRKR